MTTHIHIHHDADTLPLPTQAPERTGVGVLRSRSYQPPRRRWPGVLAATIVGAAIGAAVLASFVDTRELSQQLQSTLSEAWQDVQQRVDSWRERDDTTAASR